VGAKNSQTGRTDLRGSGHGLNNGRLEGLNSRIRLISHRSFGFHSAAPLIALVYLCCAGILIDLPRSDSPPND